MAKVELVEFIDDLDGKPIDPDDLNRVEFEVKLPGRRAVRYALDLRGTSVAKFEKDIAKYIAKAVPVAAAGLRNTRTPGGSGLPKEEIRAIRQWAAEAGYELSDRGRLPRSVINDYEAAH